MPDDSKQIYVVDDDRDVRLTLEALLSSLGYKVQQFASAVHFLANCTSDRASCVLADVRMPGMDGLELQAEITRRRLPVSTIIITGHADVTLAVRAMKAGAFDLVEKPFDNDRLERLLPGALEAAAERLRAIQVAGRAAELLKRLSPREKEVADLVKEGLSNKKIAERLGLSSRTVELHRAKLMSKLELTSAAALVQLLLESRITDT